MIYARYSPHTAGHPSRALYAAYSPGWIPVCHIALRKISDPPQILEKA